MSSTSPRSALQVLPGGGPTHGPSRRSRSSRKRPVKRRASAASGPSIEDAMAGVKSLVEAHKHRHDEPLHLAVLFHPPRGGKHLHLLEVITGFGGGTVSRDKRVFQVGFGSTPDLPLPPHVELRMTLTSPEELEVAVRDKWPSLKPIRESKYDQSAELLWADAIGKRLWKRV